MNVLKNGTDTIVEGVYLELHNKELLKKFIEKSILEYNKSNPLSLNLITFDCLIGKIATVCRMLSFHNVHGMLVGEGANGKKSVVAISAFIKQNTLVKPHIEFHKNLEFESNWNAWLQ